MGSICKKISWHTWIFATHSLLSLLCRQVNVRTEAGSARSKRAETQYRTMIMVSHFDSWGCCGGCWRPIQGVQSKVKLFHMYLTGLLFEDKVMVNPETTRNDQYEFFTQYLKIIKMLFFYNYQVRRTLLSLTRVFWFHITRHNIFFQV